MESLKQYLYEGIFGTLDMSGEELGDMAGISTILNNLSATQASYEHGKFNVNHITRRSYFGNDDIMLFSGEYTDTIDSIESWVVDNNCCLHKINCAPLHIEKIKDMVINLNNNNFNIHLTDITIGSIDNLSIAMMDKCKDFDKIKDCLRKVNIGTLNLRDFRKTGIFQLVDSMDNRGNFIKGFKCDRMVIHYSAMPLKSYSIKIRSISPGIDFENWYNKILNNNDIKTGKVYIEYSRPSGGVTYYEIVGPAGDRKFKKYNFIP